MTENCGTCRYFVIHTRFDAELRVEVNLKTGSCQRNAPRSRLTRQGEPTAGFWPIVTKQKFCGEWRRDDRENAAQSAPS